MILQRMFKTGLFANDLQKRFNGSKKPSVVNKADAIWLKEQLQHMGPTYIKIGQFMSSRRDVFDKSLVDALKDLQDNVLPLEKSTVRKIMTSNLPLNKFKNIELQALASASIGQVHRAQLKNGRNVVVKVKRPDIEAIVNQDIDVLGLVLRAMETIGLANISETREIVEDFREFVLKEADYVNELQNIKTFIKSYSENPNVRLPLIYEDLCNENVLVMEYVPSAKFSALKPKLTKEQRSRLAYKLMDVFVQQFINDGVLHGDPHEGNIGVSTDGKIVMYDMGHIITIGDDTKRLMKQLFFEIMVENTDAAMEVVKRLDKLIEVRDEKKLKTYINKYIQYIKTIDINVLKVSDSSSAFETLPVKFDGVIFRLIRVFGLIEGICKDLDADFSYSNVFMQYSDSLLGDNDFIEYKVRADLKAMLSSVMNIL